MIKRWEDILPPHPCLVDKLKAMQEELYELRLAYHLQNKEIKGLKMELSKLGELRER